MNTNDNHKKLNIDEIRDLLSSYIDGEVTDEERALVEQYLNESAELRQDLETLQQTVSLLSALPKVPAPRPFTLSEADIEAIKPSKKSGWGIPSWLMGWAGVSVAALLVMVVGLTYVMQSSGGDILSQPIALVRDQNEETMAVEAESASEEAPAESPEDEMFAEEIMEEDADIASPSLEYGFDGAKEEAAMAKAAGTRTREKDEMSLEMPAGGSSLAESSMVEATALEAEDSSTENEELIYEEEDTSTDNDFQTETVMAEPAEESEFEPFSAAVGEANADMPADDPTNFYETEDEFIEEAETDQQNTFSILADDETTPTEQSATEAQPMVMDDEADDTLPPPQMALETITSTNPTPANNLATLIITSSRSLTDTVLEKPSTTMTNTPLEIPDSNWNNIIIVGMGFIIIVILLVGWLKRR